MFLMTVSVPVWSQTPGQNLEKGRYYLAHQQAQESLIYFDLARQSVPQCPFPYIFSGLAWRQLDESDRSIDAFQKARSLDPEILSKVFNGRQHLPHLDSLSCGLHLPLHDFDLLEQGKLPAEPMLP